jgi:hypothetical protein
MERRRPAAVLSRARLLKLQFIAISLWSNAAIMRLTVRFKPI